MFGFAPISSDPIAALYNESTPPPSGDQGGGGMTLMGVG